MIGMDRSSTYCFESVVDVSTLVQRIRVDSDLNIVCIGKIQTGVDRRWCRAPIFVKLEATSTGAKDIRDRRLGVGCVSLSAETEVERQIVRRFKHHFDVRRTWGASGRRCPRARASPPAVHGGDATGNCFVTLLWANEMNVCIYPSRRDDHFLAGDDVGSWSYDHFFPRCQSNAMHHIRVPGLADVVNLTSLDSNVSLDHTQFSVYDDCIGNDSIQREIRGNRSHLAHSLA
mmetsp:Transcript_24758/g.58728  ORF Transcript_24758/g.58728 Transcript_24758/m.58728 type:complete len:231 (+) Transcript_24758:2073-2765(+)